MYVGTHVLTRLRVLAEGLEQPRHTLRVVLVERGLGGGDNQVALLLLLLLLRPTTYLLLLLALLVSAATTSECFTTSEC